MIYAKQHGQNTLLLYGAKITHISSLWRAFMLLQYFFISTGVPPNKYLSTAEEVLTELWRCSCVSPLGALDGKGRGFGMEKGGFNSVSCYVCGIDAPCLMGLSCSSGKKSLLSHAFINDL